MPSASTNGISIEYEIGGAGPPLLLVMGLGGQLSDWPRPFVELLERHFTVIRFDNRDIGLSTKIDAPVPTRRAFARAMLRPGRATAPYESGRHGRRCRRPARRPGHRARACRRDVDGGHDRPGHGSRSPPRVWRRCARSCRTPAAVSRVGPTPRVMAALVRRVDPDRDQVLDLTLDFFEMIGGRDWDREEQRQRTSASLERSFTPGGVLRQSMAIAVSPDRTERLADVRVPTLVVHGLDDTLVQPSGGIATGDAISHSRVLLLPRMGHDIPATPARRDRRCDPAQRDRAITAHDGRVRLKGNPVPAGACPGPTCRRPRCARGATRVRSCVHRSGTRTATGVPTTR